ncbi:recombinase family protein [Aliiroseovarius marinus]|uniref:recombinase family protein n=1 Tax=Aliiroseovarius marinus TaxID=2500159 RepID=UPI0024944DD1|nr:recombinase family protein [Aliiroseovarius marinus]
MSKTILYARVSTTDQTLDHQKDQAEAAGFVIDEVVADHGVSGVSTTLQERPEGKRLYDKLRHGDTLVVRWVDRLGRNYNDVTDTIRHFMRQGVVVKTVINGLTFDGATQDPMQTAVRDALIAFMAATAQAQAEATKETQKAGIAAAKKDGTKYRGKKPSYDRKALDEVMDMLGKGAGASEIANTVEVRVKDSGEWKARKLTRQTVLRIKKDPAAAEEVLSKWGM